jgi:hypothetical protein
MPLTPGTPTSASLLADPIETVDVDWGMTAVSV